MAKFWIGVAHLKQVHMMRDRAIVAFAKGKKSTVTKLSPGDGVLYYAPKSDFEGDPVQQFAALATVTGPEPEELAFTQEFTAWAMAVDYQTVTPTPIRPMLEDLSFIKSPRHWGMAFRRSQFEIAQADFDLIAKALHS